MSQFWSLSYSHVSINPRKLAEGSVGVQHHGSLKLFWNSVLKKQKQTLKNDAFVTTLKLIRKKTYCIVKFFKGMFYIITSSQVCFD